jgi:AcrR family transcriptional regulator
MELAKARPRRAQQRERTRRDLVAAGLRVVAEVGFGGATTAAIAKATGKAHGTVFVHFRTREDLVSELVSEVGRAITERLAALDQQAPSLDDVLRAHLTALAENEALYARLLGEAASLPLSARAYVFALQSGIALRMRNAYARAQAQGEVRKLDPVTLSNLWVALTNHYLMHRDLFAPGASVIEACGDRLRHEFMALIRA